MEVLIRIAIAAAAGALMRMLQVFGWPDALALGGMFVAGAVMSWRLEASRLFAVLAVSAGHLVAYLCTQNPAAAVVENPATATLIANAARLFLPVALPAAGSIVSLRIELRWQERRSEEQELTEEALLAEKIPALDPVQSYIPPDLDELDRTEAPVSK